MKLTILSDTFSGESQARIRHCSEVRFRASSSLDTVTMDPSCSKNCIKTNFKELQDTVLYHVSQSEIKSEALIKLKENFGEVIGRKRDLDRIRDFASLFNMLKKRDELSYHKLSPFKFTSDIIGDKILKDKILKFEEKWQGYEFRDLYENGKFPSVKENRLEGTFFKKENTENDRLLSGDRRNNLKYEEKNSLIIESGLKKLSVDPELRSFEGEKIVRGTRRKKSNYKSYVTIICTFILVFSIFSGFALYASIFLRFTATTLDNANYSQNQEGHSSKATSLPNMPGYNPYNSTRETQIGKRVLNRVSDRIGNRWRDMARNLDIREFDIDALDAKYPRDLKEKAYQSLIIAQVESDPRRWKSILMRALVEARRKDLADWVDENYDEN